MTADVFVDVNEDGQVIIRVRVDGFEQAPQGSPYATRAESRTLALAVLSKQSEEGERAAVEWLCSKGWDVRRK